MGISPLVFTNQRKRRGGFQNSTWAVMSELLSFSLDDRRNGVCIVRLVNIICRNACKEKEIKK